MGDKNGKKCFAAACFAFGLSLAIAASSTINVARNNVGRNGLYPVIGLIATLLLAGLLLLYVYARGKKKSPLPFVIFSFFIMLTCYAAGPKSVLSLLGSQGGSAGIYLFLSVLEIFPFILFCDFLSGYGRKRFVHGLGLALLICACAEFIPVIMEEHFTAVFYALEALIPMPLLLYAMHTGKDSLLGAGREEMDLVYRWEGKGSSNLQLYIAISLLVLSFIISSMARPWGQLQMSDAQLQILHLCSTFGALLTCAFILFFESRMEDCNFIELCLELLIPVAMLGIFLAYTAESDGISYSVPMNMAQKLMLFLAFACPRFCKGKRSELFYSAIYILAYAMGRYLWDAFNSVSHALENGQTLSSGVLSAAVCILLLMWIYRIWIDKKGNSSTHAANSAATQSPQAKRRFMNACLDLASIKELTPRENDIFILLAKGRSAEYIAKSLVVSAATVRSHAAHIYKKLDISSQQDLIDAVEEQMRANEENAAAESAAESAAEGAEKKATRK